MNMKKLSKHIKGLLTAVLMLSLIPNTAAAEPDRKEALDAMRTFATWRSD
jgi:hypothetical protein